jgi:hypothetical protein
MWVIPVKILIWKIIERSQAWWCTAVILAHRRLRKEDHEFETSLGYIMRPCLKKQKQKKKLIEMIIRDTISKNSLKF